MTEKCDTKQEILKTALKLFSAKGYHTYATRIVLIG